MSLLVSTTRLALVASNRVVVLCGSSPQSHGQRAAVIKRFFSSPPTKKSSQFLWQVGTAAALVATYVGVNAAMKYAQEASNNDDYDPDSPGESRKIYICL